MENSNPPKIDLLDMSSPNPLKIDLVKLSDTHSVVDEVLARFEADLAGVEKLWRITDLRAPNYFTLRTLRNGTLEEEISLMDMLSEFIENNTTIDKFDLFFCYMVRYKLHKKYPKHYEDLINLNSVYLEINRLIQTVRSTPDFFEKISYIKITPGNEEKPFCQHWELKYTDPRYDKDKDIINLLSSCCRNNPAYIADIKAYLEMIYSIDVNMAQGSPILITS